MGQTGELTHQRRCWPTPQATSDLQLYRLMMTIKIPALEPSNNMKNTIQIQALTLDNFTPFGEVISCQGHDYFHINHAQTERYHAPAMTEILGEAQAGISIFRNIKTTTLPLPIDMLERHPIGSQAFIPMQGQKFLIVVAPNLNAEQPDLQCIRAFMSDGTQGVNYRAGTWHHPLLTLESPSDFAVVDRLGTGHNCDVFKFPESVLIQE